MIVNLKHLKKQCSVVSPFGTTYLDASVLNPRKVLFALTAVQVWLQFLSLLLLINSCLDQRYFTKDDDAKPTGYGKAYFVGSLVLHSFDIIVAMFSTYHLRNASTMYNYLQEISAWVLVNNVYIMSSIMCFAYICSNFKSFVICLRLIMTCMFTSYKVYIVHEMYKNEKSSNLVLEQNSVLLESSPKPTNNGNSESPESNPGHAVVVELETTVDTPEVKEDKDSKVSTTVSENVIVQ